MTLKQMEFFIAVCEKRSITKASQEYFISQQAMSKNIQDLEQELGAKLLVRSPQGVTLTRYGESVYKEAKAILEKVRRIETTVDWLKREEKEILRCGMAFGSMSALGFDLLADFMCQNPQIDLRIQDLPDLLCEESFLKGELDAACMSGPVEGEGIHSVLLRKEPMALCIPRNNILYSRERVDIEDLAGQPMLLNGCRFRTSHAFCRLCEEAGFKPHIALTANETQLLLEMCARGVGIALLPAHMARQGIAGLRILPLPAERLEWSMYFVLRKDREFSPGLSLLLRYLKDRIHSIRD